MGDYLDDEYVAKLLAEDAKKTSSRYASESLSALSTTRKPVNAPKPNTRFLGNIVRQADQHNAALKQKEEAEARSRLRAMRNERHRERDRADTDGHRRKRRRTEEDRGDRRHRSHQDRHSQRRKPNEDRNRLSRSRSRSSSPRRRPHREESRRRSRSPGSTRLDQRRYDEGRLSPRGRRNDIHEDSSIDEEQSRPKAKSDASRPTRGRGAGKNHSGIDDRFSSTYNPANDEEAHSDISDADAWDMAVEAFRNRAKWKTNQKERLREAGFDETQISHWEKGALNDDNKDEDVANVKWKKLGEARAWDVGKIAS